MTAHQKRLIAAIYDETATQATGIIKSNFETWRTDIYALRGELDRKKKATPEAIVKVVGCTPGEADVFRMTFSIERYLEYRAVHILRHIGNSRTDLPFVAEAFARAEASKSLWERTANSDLETEHRDGERTAQDYPSTPFEDVFQAQYQKLLPRQVRHALGQFYTPPWLARHVVRTAGFRWEDPSSLNGTLIDPTCGSGAFLLAAAEEVRQAVASGALSPSDGQTILARQLRGSDIEALPALLAYTGICLASYALESKYKISSPTPIDGIRHVDALDRTDEQQTADFVVGNPPWANWEYMPKEFRDKHKSLWPLLGVFDSGRSTANSKEDISALIIANALDHHLKPGGSFGFLVPESLVKATRNHAGFRRMQFGAVPVDYAVTLGEDFVKVRPFEGVANRTIALYGTKGRATQFPVEYRKWTNLNRRTQTNTGSSAIEGEFELLEAKLSDVSDPTSSWSTSSKLAAEIHRFIDGQNAYQGRTGLFTGGANGVFHLKTLGTDDGLVRITNVTERAKRPVPKVEAFLEPTHLYPFLRGRDVEQWNYNAELNVLLPHTPESRMKPIPEAALRTDSPATYKYLEQFRDILAERRGFATWEKTFLDTGFYACQRVGPYTFSPWKVVWRYIARDFITAVVGPELTATGEAKPTIANEKLMIIACDSEAEAFYVGGVLASAPVISHVRSRMVSTQIPPSIVQNIRIPKFDAKNPIHQAISEACRIGHTYARLAEFEGVRSQEDRIDEGAAEIWGLRSDSVATERAFLRDE